MPFWGFFAKNAPHASSMRFASRPCGGDRPPTGLQPLESESSLPWRGARRQWWLRRRTLHHRVCTRGTQHLR